MSDDQGDSSNPLISIRLGSLLYSEVTHENRGYLMENVHGLLRGGVFIWFGHVGCVLIFDVKVKKWSGDAAWVDVIVIVVVVGKQY